MLAFALNVSCADKSKCKRLKNIMISILLSDIYVINNKFNTKYRGNIRPLNYNLAKFATFARLQLLLDFLKIARFYHCKPFKSHQFRNIGVCCTVFYVKLDICQCYGFFSTEFGGQGIIKCF